MISRKQAKEMAQKATVDQIHEMLLAARTGVKNWEKRSSNKALSLGVAFNICWGVDGCGGFDSMLPRYNAIRNFGEFFPGYEKPPKKDRTIKMHHQEPREVDSEPIF